jgi:short subunit dehydrogenase-like uncharacterized protein
VSWLLYGANGYTGELTAREAVRRGLRPVLAARNAAAVERLGAELGLEARAFELSPAAIATALRGVALVLHCAGPFSATAQPMISACLAARAHYLDISGEIAVFELAQARAGEARAAGVVLCPGVGFDVVPTDCVALTLKEALPEASALALGFDSRLALSRGTARTMVEGLGQGGCIRRDGRLQRVPLGYRERRIDFGAGEKLAMTIPWGDVSTAFHTTGIPNVEVYVPISPGRLRQMRRLNALRPLLRLHWVQRLLKSRIDRQSPGPDAAARAAAPVHVWGEARTTDGRTRSARLVTANGYTLTVHAALGIVERLLSAPVSAGALTPARLMGQHYVETLPGSGRIVLD